MPLKRDVEIELNNLKKKPQEIKIEEPKEKYVPLSHSTKNKDYTKVDDIILSYLPATQLDAMSQSLMPVDYATQACVKIPAGKMLKESYKTLLESLPKTIYSPGDRGLVVNDKETYFAVIQTHKHFFFKTIREALTLDKDHIFSAEKREFIKEIIFHYCLNFATEAGSLLNENIRSKQYWILLAMINSGASLFTGGIGKYGTFAKALSYSNKEVINAIYEMDPDYKSFSGQFSEMFPYDFTRYFYLQAILELSDKNLLKIATDKPRLLPFFFQMLDDIISRRHSSHIEYLENGGMIYSFCYNSEKALNTKFRLLQICKKEMSFTKNDKEMMLRVVCLRINKEPTIAALTKISKDSRALTVIDYQRHRYFDKAIGFFNKTTHYPESKTRFIELLQKAAVAMASTDAFVGSFASSSHYLAACQSILDLPFFADSHCEKGVSKDGRKAMQKRMAEIQAAIPSAPAPRSI